MILWSAENMWKEVQYHSSLENKDQNPDYYTSIRTFYINRNILIWNTKRHR